MREWGGGGKGDGWVRGWENGGVVGGRLFRFFSPFLWRCKWIEQDG